MPGDEDAEGDGEDEVEVEGDDEKNDALVGDTSHSLKLDPSKSIGGELPTGPAWAEVGSEEVSSRRGAGAGGCQAREGKGLSRGPSGAKYV
jgi:hypothetical protein